MGPSEGVGTTISLIRLADAWSPNGEQIAYVRHRTADPAFEVWVMQADGTRARSVGSGLAAVWSPDSSSLAVVHIDSDLALGVSGWDIFVVRSDGSASRRLTNGLPYRRDSDGRMEFVGDTDSDDWTGLNGLGDWREE